MQEYEKINSTLRKNKKQTTMGELAKTNGKGIFKTRQDLLGYLYDEISKVAANADVNKYKHLYKAFKYFDNLTSPKDKEQVLKGLIKLQKLCNQKIKEHKKILVADNIYEKMLSIIKVTLLNLSCDSLQTINRSKAELLRFIIYEMKNLNYVFELLKTYPDYVLMYDNKGYVLEEIVDKYTELLNNKDYSYDTIYFQKVIKLFVENPKFNENNELKIKLLNKIKENVKRNQKSTFFMNELIGDISKTDINKKNIKDLTYKYGIESSNSNELIEEAKNNLNVNNNEILDLRHLKTITIDSRSTRVYDDACSIQKTEDGNYLLSVFVADVASYVPKNSLVDKVACQKSETLYLPRQVITMLPSDLTDKLTLKEKEDRTVIGHFFVLNEEMEVLDFKIDRCLINVSKNYSYEEIINNLNNSTNPEELEMLLQMSHVGLALHLKDDTKQEYRDFKNLKKQVNEIETFDMSIGTIIIMEFMTLTNQTVATYFTEHPEIPFIYRNNKKYGTDLRDKLFSLSVESDKVAIKTIYNNLGSVSFYSPYNFGHKGLKLDAYCHSTNPLRNYASLACQRIILDNIINNERIENFDELFEEVKELCDHMNKRIDMNKSCLEECNQLKKKK